MFITVDIVKSSPLQMIIEENPFFFFDDLEKKENLQLILTLFLIWEKNKGNKSFYFPFLEVYSKRKSISDWSFDHVNNLCSNYLKKEVKEKKFTCLFIFHAKLF